MDANEREPILKHEVRAARAGAFGFAFFELPSTTRSLHAVRWRAIQVGTFLPDLIVVDFKHRQPGWESISPTH